MFDFVNQDKVLVVGYFYEEKFFNYLILYENGFIVEVDILF